jgi:hypothetical protein
MIFHEKALSINREILSTSDCNKKDELKFNYDKYKEYVSNLKDYQQIIFHQNVARAQRLAYKKDHTYIDGLRNKILIEIDFKQKILIGMSPRQANREFYEQELRSCLGNFVNFIHLYKKFIGNDI